MTLLTAAVAALIMMKVHVQGELKRTRSKRNQVRSEVVMHMHWTLLLALYSGELSVQLTHQHSLPPGPLHPSFPWPYHIPKFSFLAHNFSDSFSKLNCTQILNCKLLWIKNVKFLLFQKKSDPLHHQNSIQNITKVFKKKNKKKNHHN